MGSLFKKKKLADTEREAWTAQLLEIREEQLDRYGATPVGGSWQAHDDWVLQVFAEYMPRYGIPGVYSQMAIDKVYGSDYRKYSVNGSVWMGEELDHPDVDSYCVYWLFTQENGDGGLIKLSDSWKAWTASIRKDQKEYGVENTRKAWQAERWKKCMNIAAIAVAAAAVITVVVLCTMFGVPVAGALPVIVKAVGAAMTAGQTAGAVGATLLAGDGVSVGEAVAMTAAVVSTTTQLTDSKIIGTFDTALSGDDVEPAADKPSWWYAYDEIAMDMGIINWRAYIIDAGVPLDAEAALYAEYKAYL